MVNCSVLLDVEVETDNGTTLAILPIHLVDNGNGGNDYDDENPHVVRKVF